VDALAAGCDLLLAPADVGGVLEAIDLARDEGRLDLDAAEASRARRAFWATWSARGHGGVAREPTLDDVLWARQVADVVVHPVRGTLLNIGMAPDVIQVIDGAGGATAGAATPGEPMGTHFIETLRAMGRTPRLVDSPAAGGDGAVVIAVFGGAAPGAGRAGYGDDTRRRVARALAAARQAGRGALVLVFGHPRLAAELPEAEHVGCCWSGSRAMQEAAARRLG
jgi:hypothetical protein